MLVELARIPCLAVWFESLMDDEKTAEPDDNKGTFWHFSNMRRLLKVSRSKVFGKESFVNQGAQSIKSSRSDKMKDNLIKLQLFSNMKQFHLSTSSFQF